MEETGTAIILAGGRSTRMGFGKEDLVINGERLLYYLYDTLRMRFAQVIVVSNTLAGSDTKKLEVVSDELVGFGPLGGIHAGLQAAKSRYSYVLACDMPHLNMDYVSFLQSRLPSPDREISALVTAVGCRMEPFNGFYNRSLIDPIRVFVATGRKSLTEFLRSQNAVLVDEETARRFSQDWSMFANINTPSDLLALTTSLATKGCRTLDKD
ncbi:MAG: molybdenum cofactor guanylyltransferase [Selenomonadales bacterium]|nr:molybdenum cofactor guanylyltransferase [Selenomonadales bacterium]